MNNQFITMNSISTNITNNFELLRKDIVIYNQSVNTKIQEETNKTNSLMHEYYTKNKEYELSDAKHKIVQLETYLFNKDLFTTSNHKRNE